MDADFVIDEDNRFFEIVRTPLEPENAGNVASTVPDIELTVYEIIGKVKKRAKAGRGQRTFNRVRFHSYLPEVTEGELDAWSSAATEEHASERAYRVDLRDRIYGLLNEYDVKPSEDGWRTLSKIAIREAERLNIEVSEEPPEGLPWRSYALSLVVKLASFGPGEIAAPFRAFQIAPPDLENVRDVENLARDRYVNRVIEEAQRKGELDPKPFDCLLDELIEGGFLSDRAIGDDWRLPDDPPPVEPRKYIYRDADRSKWSGRALRRPNKAQDENTNPLRDRAVASLKATYYQRKGKSRPMSRSVIEAAYYERVFSDLNRAATEVEQRLR